MTARLTRHGWRLKSTKMRGKKGQFYIVIAIILLVYAFAVSRTSDPLSQQRDTFRELHQNFAHESARTINSAIFEQANATQRFEDFAENYQQYTRTREPAFGFFYIFSDGSSLALGNRLDISANYSAGNTTATLAVTETTSIPFQNITIIVEGISHAFAFDSTGYTAKAFFRQKNNEGTRVHAIK